MSDDVKDALEALGRVEYDLETIEVMLRNMPGYISFRKLHEADLATIRQALTESEAREERLSEALLAATLAICHRGRCPGYETCPTHHQASDDCVRQLAALTPTEEE